MPTSSGGISHQMCLILQVTNNTGTTYLYRQVDLSTDANIFSIQTLYTTIWKLLGLLRAEVNVYLGLYVIYPRQSFESTKPNKCHSFRCTSLLCGLIKDFHVDRNKVKFQHFFFEQYEEIMCQQYSSLSMKYRPRFFIKGFKEKMQHNICIRRMFLFFQIFLLLLQ